MSCCPFPSLSANSPVNACATRPLPREQRGFGRTGRPFTKCNVTDLLQNRLYRGDLVHRGRPLPGIHDPIVTERSWTKVQEAIAKVACRHRPLTRPSVPNPLKGLVFGPNGRPISQTFGYNRERAYRYYTSAGARRYGSGTSPIQRYRAPEFDAAVLAEVEGSFPNGPSDRQGKGRPETVWQLVSRIDVGRDEMVIALRAGETIRTAVAGRIGRMALLA